MIRALFLSFALLMALPASAQTYAAANQETSVLRRFLMDQLLPLSMKPSYGQVQVDPRRELVTVDLGSPQGVQRMQFRIFAKKGSCGSVIFKARGRAGDVVTVWDHRRRVCEDYRPYVTEVIHEGVFQVEPGQDPRHFMNFYGGDPLL